MQCVEFSLSQVFRFCISEIHGPIQMCWKTLKTSKTESTTGICCWRTSRPITRYSFYDCLINWPPSLGLSPQLIDFEPAQQIWSNDDVSGFGAVVTSYTPGTPVGFLGILILNAFWKTFLSVSDHVMHSRSAFSKCETVAITLVFPRLKCTVTLPTTLVEFNAADIRFRPIGCLPARPYGVMHARVVVVVVMQDTHPKPGSPAPMGIPLSRDGGWRSAFTLTKRTCSVPSWKLNSQLVSPKASVVCCIAATVNNRQMILEKNYQTRYLATKAKSFAARVASVLVRVCVAHQWGGGHICLGGV